MITTTRHHGPISAGCSPRVAAKGGSQGTRAACIRERYLHQTSKSRAGPEPESACSVYIACPPGGPSSVRCFPAKLAWA